MAPLPSGIVTFLFTDIEGSTRLWEHEPDLMWAAVARHNELLDSVIHEHHGFHFKTIGDAFQAAFASPADALRAVIDAQRRFESETWEGIGPLRVRMALHCGPAHPINGDYLAPCLNRLSRMMSTGYGGQILISDLVRRRVELSLPDGVTLRELGRHRLRDLLESERITQVVIDGLQSEFPPLKSLELHPTNLPIQPNPLVGRENDLATIMSMLREDNIRLVTLTGVGGTGKTRLALQAGAEMIDDFEHGVFFVDLAPVPDAASVIPTIAMTLGVPETGGLSLLESLHAHLGEKTLLLVLDNFEHVLEAGTDVTSLLEHCPNIRILATSRAPLRVRAEHVRPVSPLETPDPRHLPPLDELVGIDAISLFVQRATAADPSFTLTGANAAPVAEICVRLDGIPLAIELAAARIRAIKPAPLLALLDRRLEVLTDGSQDLPARQRTLRATIEWSYDLLSPDAQALFRRVSVFAGGFTLEAAGAMQDAFGDARLNSLDGVTALVDRSLLRRVDAPEGEPRFSMLETLREFGLEQLEQSGGMDETRDAHAAWSLSLAEAADGKLTGPEQSTWLDRLELEHDNLRGALAWTDTPGRYEHRLRLAAALARFWLIHGHYTEGRRWLDAAIDGFGGTPTNTLETGAMTGSGHLAYAQGAFAAARLRYDAALQAARALDHKEAEATLLNACGNVAFAVGNVDEAKDLYTQSLRLGEALNDTLRRANALGNLGAVAYLKGDMESALARYNECLALLHELGNTQGMIHVLLNLIFLLAPMPGQADRARQYGEECLRLSRQIGDRQAEALVLSGLGILEQIGQHLDVAETLHQQSLDIYTDLSDPSGMGRATGNLGAVAVDKGDLPRARDLLFESLRLNQETAEMDGVSFALEVLAEVATGRGIPEIAARMLGAAERLREEAGATLQPELKRRHEQVVSGLRKALAKRYKTEIARGRDMQLSDLLEDVDRQLRPDAPLGRERRSSLDVALSEIDSLLPDTTRPPPHQAGDTSSRRHH